MNTTLEMPLIIRALGRGKKGSRSLTEAEAQFAMSAILNRTITGPQLGALLMLMRVKEETAEEICGMVQACEQQSFDSTNIRPDVNWPAYAGKKKQPSWYVLAAKLLAQNGIRVLMHGGGEHTAGRQYAREVCAALNLPLAESLAEAQTQLEIAHFSYISLDRFHPVLSELIDMKSELGLRSPVNTLVRHLNPLHAKVTLQGMFHPAYLPLHHDSAFLLKQHHNIVLKGDGGEFEVRPDSECKIALTQPTKGLNETFPAVLGARAIRPETVSLEPLVQLWEGQSDNEYGTAAVIQTAALVLTQCQDLPLAEAQETARSWWTNR